MTTIALLLLISWHKFKPVSSGKLTSKITKSGLNLINNCLALLPSKADSVMIIVIAKKTAD